MTHAYVYDALRTPRGKNRHGALNDVPAVDLVVTLMRALGDRHADLDLARIEDVVLGVVSPVGEQGGDIARTAVLAAGLPESVPGMQVNRFCASGLEAVNLAAQKVGFGSEDLVLAGGVESMSRVPLGSDGGAFAQGDTASSNTSLVPQGISADLIATIEGFSREDVDAYAARSQQRADVAWRERRFARSIVPVVGPDGAVLLDHDEHRRPGSTVESLGQLPASFARLGVEGGYDAIVRQRYPHLDAIDHVHGPGNSSGIVDGAGLVLVGSQAAGAASGMTPRARIVSTAVVGTEPIIMLTGPAPATQKALDRAGLSLEDIDLFEVNEAFGAVVLKWQRDLGVPDEKVNVNGGAIALGHPLGATGAMILGTLLDELERRDLRRGLATLCVGAGMGIATVIERI